MKSFAAWLHDALPDAPDLTTLKAFAVTNLAR